MYAVKLTSDAVADFKALPKNVRNRLAKIMQQELASNPHGVSSPLRPPLEGWRSFHYGAHRVVFTLLETERVVVIAAIGRHHTVASRDIYRRLEQAARAGRLAEALLRVLRELPKR